VERRTSTELNSIRRLIADIQPQSRRQSDPPRVAFLAGRRERRDENNIKPTSPLRPVGEQDRHPAHRSDAAV
jgi:hypothetical protein